MIPENKKKYQLNNVHSPNIRTRLYECTDRRYFRGENRPENSLLEVKSRKSGIPATISSEY